MADNVTLNTMTGGDVAAADDIGGVKFQRIKLIHGADGVNAGDVSTANGLPVSLIAGTASIGTLAANSGVDIGDVTINNASGASAVNIQDGGNSITIDNADITSIKTAVETIDNAISGSGFNITQFGGTNVVTAGVSGMLAVGGNIAHDSADTSNPLKIGGRAQEPTAVLEEVADNDRVDAAFDRQGRLAIWNGYPVQSAVINCSTNGDNTIVAAAGAGKRIAVLGFSIISDGTTDARWEDGASGTAKTGQYPFQAREGISRNGAIQPIFVGSANTLLNLELNAAVNVHGEVAYVTMED
jgi:hypothetical protein